MLKVLDTTNSGSLNQTFRRKRFKLFLETIKTMNKPVKILDIGGTYNYWKNMNINFNDVHIVLLNLDKQVVDHPSFSSVIGDATNLKEYGDNSFDIVYSNSVLEHLFTADNQNKMANEVRRVGKIYMIQTPNKWFPIEPHYLFPFFQFFPKKVKIYLTYKFALGNYRKASSLAHALRRVEEVKLLSYKELKRLFPDGKIWKEKIFFFSKSFIAHNNINY